MNNYVKKVLTNNGFDIDESSEQIMAQVCRNKLCS